MRKTVAATMGALAFGALSGSAAGQPARSVNLPPDKMAALCVKVGCAPPGMLGMTYSYTCEGGDTMTALFNEQTQTLDVQVAGMSGPLKLSRQYGEPSGFRWANSDFSLMAKGPHVSLTAAINPGASAECTLVGITRTPKSGEG